MSGGWRGCPAGVFSVIGPGQAGGGGLVPSYGRPGPFACICPGSAGGGGQQQSAADLLTGYGGCGGPGPGALIGLRS